MGESRSRRRLIWFLVSVIVVLAGCNVFMLVQSGLAGQAVSSMWRAVTRAEGGRVLLSRLTLGQAPEEAVAQLGQRGSDLLEAGNYREALDAFERAVELAPDDPMVHIGLAQAYEGLDDRENALVHLEQAARFDPSNAEVQRHLGRLRLMAGEFESGVSALKRSVALEPEHPLGHFLLAMAYVGGAEDGFAKAEVQYQEALKADPTFGGAHMGLGYLYKSRPGMEALALEQFKRALDVGIEIGDESLAAQARTELAELYFAEDNFSRCIDELKPALERDPTDAAAHRRIGLCYAMRGGEGDLEKAVAELERALALDATDIDLYYLYLGEHLAAEGDNAAAAAAWELFLRFSKDEDMKAQVRERIGRLGE